MSATASSMVFKDEPARLPKWMNTLLVIALGWALAVLTMKALMAMGMLPTTETIAANASASSAASTVAAAPASNRAENNPVKLAQITAGFHLFGDVSKAPVKVEESKPAPVVTDTSLQLELAGVFAYDPAEKAIAIINQRGKEQGAFGIGDKIVGEVTLEEVHKEYVILNNRGKRERLKLPENSQPIATRPIPTASNNAQAQSNNGQGTDQSAPVELPSTPGALRDTLARNPSMLGKIVAAEPYQENGKLLGYRITPKQNPEILEAQGILPGDVITRVNNIQLNSQKQGIRALRNAVKAQALEVTILRDGAEIPLSISLAQ